MHRLIRIETGPDGNSWIERAELARSKTQYLEDFLRATAERKQSGNAFPPCFHFVSALLPLPDKILSREETKWQHVSTSERSNFNEDEDYDADKTVSIQTDSTRRRDQEVEAQ